VSLADKPTREMCCKLSERTNRTDASHLREALDAHLARHRDVV